MDSQEIIKKSRSIKTTTQQFEELVKYMEMHSEFAANKFLSKEGRIRHNQQWNQLQEMLNALSQGPGKTVKQWQTVWRDLKSNASKKASKLRNERNRTGNFPINLEPLDNLEQRVIACMGLEYVQGASNCPDSTPEEEEYQIQLENGNESVLQIPPASTSIADFINIENIRHNNNNNDNAGIPQERNIDDDDDDLCYMDVLQSCNETVSSNTTTKRRNTDTDRNTTETAQQKRSRNARSGETLQNRRSKKRIGAQLHEAREKFSQIAENHSEALQLLSEASMKQAEAALLRAQTEERRLQFEEQRHKFEERRIILEEKKLRTDQQLIQVLTHLQEVLTEMIQK